MIETACIYAVFFAGVFLLEFDLFGDIFMAAKNRIRMRRHFESGRDSLTNQRGIMSHVNILLMATTGQKGRNAVNTFIFVSAIIGIGVYFILQFLVPMGIALLAATVGALLPYGILRTRLQRIRVKGSREGDILVTELLNNYKINYYNMKEAVEVTATTMENAPHCKRLLLDVAKGFNKAATKEDFKGILDVFRYSLDTSWGNVLATNIYFAQVLGIKVTNSLSDLVESISQSRRVGEFSKRENNEAQLMLRYLAPICFLLTILGACKFFGFTFQKYCTYQFGTPTGLSWFIGIILFYIAGVLVNEFLSKKKMDL
ncbi:MAG TPA: hypothetical protein VJY37_00425 [Anaerovoracaceae bacterium]|nr:hypothetical protein [Anaerovoracaceae bacterium]